MRYLAIALTFCFMLAPLEAKTKTTSSKSHKTKVKGHRAAKRKVNRAN